MKNNKLYKILLLLFNLFPICCFIFIFLYVCVNPMFDMYAPVLNETVSNEPTIFNEIISYVYEIVKISGIYILIFRALKNIITRKNYKNKGFNIFAKTVSIIVCICLFCGAYYILHDADVVDISTLVYMLIILLIPLIMIWAFSELFKLKYEIKDKKYILLFALSVAFIVFGICMFVFEGMIYSSWGVFQFSFYVESALIPIYLFNIYTLLVVRETKKENIIIENIKIIEKNKRGLKKKEM